MSPLVQTLFLHLNVLLCPQLLHSHTRPSVKGALNAVVHQQFSLTQIHLTATVHLAQRIIPSPHIRQTALSDLIWQMMVAFQKERHCLPALAAHFSTEHGHRTRGSITCFCAWNKYKKNPATHSSRKYRASKEEQRSGTEINVQTLHGQAKRRLQSTKNELATAQQKIYALQKLHFLNKDQMNAVIKKQ